MPIQPFAVCRTRSLYEDAALHAVASIVFWQRRRHARLGPTCSTHATKVHGFQRFLALQTVFDERVKQAISAFRTVEKCNKWALHSRGLRKGLEGLFFFLPPR